MDIQPHSIQLRNPSLPAPADNRPASRMRPALAVVGVGILCLASARPLPGADGPDTLAPIISNIQPALVAAGVPFAITATVNDQATGNSNIGLVLLGVDGEDPVVMSASDGAFDEPIEEAKFEITSGFPVGVHEVVVIAGDSGNNVSSASSLLVVYDPSAGFVTGSGWIDSPSDGANTWFASLAGILGNGAEDRAGKANFGFVSKYKPRAATPDGSTHFVFAAGAVEFRSTSYEWLVVNRSGSNAQFKGVGQINETGNYGFIIWATDGTRFGTPDTFRIRIWDRNNGDALIYDNGVEQAIGGGNILVQTK